MSNLILLKRTIKICSIPIFFGGCFLNDRFTVIYSSKRKKLQVVHYLPLIFGLTIIPTLIVISPIFLVDSMFNLCIIDKFVDKIIDNYDLDIKRYHQHDGSDNKYYSNSLFEIYISKKYPKNTDSITS